MSTVETWVLRVLIAAGAVAVLAGTVAMALFGTIGVALGTQDLRRFGGDGYGRRGRWPTSSACSAPSSQP